MYIFLFLSNTYKSKQISALENQDLLEVSSHYLNFSLSQYASSAGIGWSSFFVIWVLGFDLVLYNKGWLIDNLQTQPYSEWIRTLTKIL